MQAIAVNGNWAFVDGLKSGGWHTIRKYSFGDDEIRIRVEDQNLGKSVQIGGGDKKKIDRTVQFAGKVSVKLYENDVEGDDYLAVLTAGFEDLLATG